MQVCAFLARPRRVALFPRRPTAPLTSPFRATALIHTRHRDFYRPQRAFSTSWRQQMWSGDAEDSLKARDRETIFAVSSGSGRAGVAVIRVSGPQATTVRQREDFAGDSNQQIFEKMTKRKAIPEPRKLVRCLLRSPQRDEPIDDVLLAYFKAPNSFTGEDIVEIHCHGSMAVLKSIGRALTDLGFSHALAGEFTRRAFYNEKADLVEIEGLADLLSAETEEQRKQALFHLQGKSGEVLRGWSEVVARSLARLEALIDFGEDEHLEDEVLTQVSHEVGELVDQIREHLDSAERGQLVHTFYVVTAALTIGKSSLLNLMAEKEAAIVSPLAGTTRDVVEVPLDIGGYPVTIADTAGLNEDSDSSIELIGIERARERFESSHLQLFVMDITQLLSASSSTMELLSKAKNPLFVFNKVDIASEDDKQRADEFVKQYSVQNVVYISCQSNEGAKGLASFSRRTVDSVMQNIAPPSQISIITRERHRSLVVDGLHHLQAFLQNPASLDTSGEELRLAMEAFGSITGKVNVEDLLDRIFKEFCIGK